MSKIKGGSAFLVYNFNGELLFNDSNLCKFCKKYGLSRSHVRECLKGKRKSSGGLIFIYEENNGK